MPSRNLTSQLAITAQSMDAPQVRSSTPRRNLAPTTFTEPVISLTGTKFLMLEITLLKPYLHLRKDNTGRLLGAQSSKTKHLFLAIMRGSLKTSEKAFVTSSRRLQLAPEICAQSPSRVARVPARRRRSP